MGLYSDLTIDFLGPEEYWSAMAKIFGEYAPKPRVEYKGSILFAFGQYLDELMILESRFTTPEGLSLDDLVWPWYCEDEAEMVKAFIKENRKDLTYGIYHWEGTYMKFESGKCRFWGEFKRLKLPLDSVNDSC